MAGKFSVIPDDETADKGAERLSLVPVQSDISDQRVCHGDNLSAVGGVGQHLLVPGHPGVEDDLPDDLPFGAEGLSLKQCSVLQQQTGPHH